MATDAISTDVAALAGEKHVALLQNICVICKGPAAEQIEPGVIYVADRGLQNLAYMQTLAAVATSCCAAKPC